MHARACSGSSTICNLHWQVRPPVLLPGKGNILMYDLLCAKFESYISVGLLGVAFKQQADVLPMTEDLYHKARAWPGTQDMAGW